MCSVHAGRQLTQLTLEKEGLQVVRVSQLLPPMLSGFTHCTTS